MKSQKDSRTNGGTMLFVLFSILVLVFPLLEGNDVKKNYAEFDRLTAKAVSDDSVRVIIKLDVPSINELTERANAYCSPKPGNEKDWGGAQASMVLMDEIANAAQVVLFQMKGEEYEVHHIYKSIPYMALRVSAAALEVLRDSSTVLYIHEDVALRLIEPVADGDKPKGEGPAAPEDSVDLPTLDNTVDIIGASDAWAMGYTGAGWYVAVLDTGIRKSHEFFTGKTVVEACFALGSDGSGPVGDCPNGLISQTGSGSAVHYSSTYEGYDHGTHVSGIAAGNNGSLFGVAKNANIIAVKVFSMFSAEDCGDAPCVMSWSSDQLAGLDYIYSIRGSYSIASANMSLGGGQFSAACDSAPQKAAIDNLRSVGIATAIATGNNGYCNYVASPSCISTSIAVGSSTDGDLESGFNNWHPTLQMLFAPGSSVYSSTGDSDTSYASWSGTSMATPHVAGSWAVIRQAKPTATVSEILSALSSTGVSITSVCDGYTTPIPRIQIDDAIDALGCSPNDVDDLLATWAGQGVYYRNSDTGAWVKLASPATLIAAGDLDGDCIDDVIGIWPGQGGVWVKYSASGSWALLSSTARHIGSGDMNGDGKPELLGTWDGQGVYWRNNTTGVWTKLATPATLITSGDLDGDGIDDLIGIWPSQGGVWVKYSQSGAWAKLSTTAVDIAAGDMNGDGRDDLLATWDGQGVYYRNSINGVWVKMATPATQVTAGDLDGDGTDDVIGIWPSQSGVWVKYSQSGAWAYLSSTAVDISAGKMRTAGAAGVAPGATAAGSEGNWGPNAFAGSLDLSANGPGGLAFAFSEAGNLEPSEQGEAMMHRVPGPGEPGFKCMEQLNLEPRIRAGEKAKDPNHE